MINEIALVCILRPERYANAAPKASPINLTKIIRATVSHNLMGSGGSATVESAISLGIAGDLAKEMRRGPVFIQMLISVDGQTQSLFAGIIDTADYSLNANRITLHCRDLAAILQERTITPRTTSDVTISDYVRTLAKEAGLAVTYVDIPENPNGDPIQLGTEFKNSTSFTTRFEPVWGTLQKLAKDTDNVCYLDEVGQLYFGPRIRKTKATSTALSYSVSSTPDGIVFQTTQIGDEPAGSSGGALLIGHPPHDLPTVDLKWSADGPSDFLFHSGLEVQHQALRHGAFIQQMTTHSVKNGALLVGTASYVNGPLATDRASGEQTATSTAAVTEEGAVITGRVIQPIADTNGPAMWIGLTVPELQQGFGDISPKNPSYSNPNGSYPLPVYSQFINGMTRDQASLRALGHAQEMQAQEVTINGEVPGSLLLLIGTPITIAGTDLSIVDNQTFVVTHVEFTYDAGEPSGHVHGFIEKITAWKVDEPNTAGMEGPSFGPNQVY